MSKFILLFLCCTNVLLAQQTIKGLVEYKVSFYKNISVDLKKPQELSPKVQSIIKNAEDVNAYLWFTENESLYLLDEKMENEVKPGINITKIFAGSSNVYYYNSKTDEKFKQTSTLGEYFRVNYSSPEWKITKEKKEIAGYICYKALSSEENNQVTAWFAPDLSLPYGPLDYNKLPGLILELRNSKLFFKAEKVELNPLNFQLKRPSKGKKISSEDYKDIAKKSVPALFSKGF